MAHHQSNRTLQRARTTLAPSVVLDQADAFFARRNAVYTAFVETRGDHHVVLRGQGGEEVTIAAHERDGATEVTGSSYLFDAQVARFLSTLPAAPAPAPVEAAPAPAPAP